MRTYSTVDRLVMRTQRILKSAVPGAPAALPPRQDTRPMSDPRLSPAQQRHAAALMRVNHAGEVAAQGLYTGQALLARTETVRQLLRESAREEAAHLTLCSRRLAELGAHPSRLTPLWYTGSAAIGILAALPGDRFSLGFVAETERQVEAHLNHHLERLPPDDRDSRAVVAKMRDEEAGHADKARNAAAIRLPGLVQQAMRATARLMTGIAYWI